MGLFPEREKYEKVGIFRLREKEGERERERERERKSFWVVVSLRV